MGSDSEKPNLDLVGEWLYEMCSNRPVRYNGSFYIDLKARSSFMNREEQSYRVYIRHEGSDLVFESVVFKGVGGDPANKNIFYETLLAQNSSIPKLNWAMIKLGSGAWRFILRCEENIDTIDVYKVKTVMDHFDYAYARYVPQLQYLIVKLELDDSGEGKEYLSKIIKGIFGQTE